LAELADRVHNFGAKLFVQLSAGPGRVARGDVIDAGFQPVSSSPNQAFFRPQVTCRELTTDEIQKLIEAFGQAGQMVAGIGVDGIEIHGHEGYLIDQFNTALWNRRKDLYGGDLRGRLRLGIEILSQIKRMTGEKFPVTFRYSIKHFIRAPWKSSLKPDGYEEIGRDIPESLAGAEILEEAGYDGLHVDAGCYEAFYWAHPPTYQPDACTIDLIRGLKKRVSFPIIAAGKLGNPQLAEQALKERTADMVGKSNGLTDAEVEQIRHGPNDEHWSPFDAALLRAADEMCADAFISDATWEILSGRYNTGQLMDVVFTVSQYTLVSMVLNTLGMQLDKGLKGFQIRNERRKKNVWL
jgi:2-enoate reductase